MGINTPKPLIDVNGVPMFERALRSFDGYPGAVRFIVVLREDDDREYGLRERILASRPDAEVVMLGHDTGGAVETCLEAADRLDTGAPLVVLDCDIAFRSDDYFDRVRSAAENGSAEVLLAFPSEGPGTASRERMRGEELSRRLRSEPSRRMLS